MTIIEKILNTQISAEHKKREKEHKSSGKLSASMLGNPLQWQILKHLGVEPKPFDMYTLKKFKRGRDVENFILNQVRKSGAKVIDQKEVEYRNTVGKADLWLPKKGENGEVIEVKSTTNAAFKYLGDKPKKNHALQACLYALALEVDEFSVLYVASDDYRTEQFTVKVSDYQDDLDAIVDEFYQTIEDEIIPVFKPKMKWQKIKKYNMYPNWINYMGPMLEKKAKELYANT